MGLPAEARTEFNEAGGAEALVHLLPAEDGVDEAAAETVQAVVASLAALSVDSESALLALKHARDDSMHHG